MEAFTVLTLLHNRLLHGLSNRAPGIEFEGVSKASRHFKREKKLNATKANKVVNVAIAYNVMRHMTKAKADAFYDRIMADIDGDKAVVDFFDND